MTKDFFPRIQQLPQRTARDYPIPTMIRAAGDVAVRAYRECLENPRLSPAKRTVSRNVARRFFRWAESRDLTLETIAASDVRAYIAETREQYVTPVRDLFERLAAEGAITGNPARRRGMPRKAAVVPEIIRTAGERAITAYLQFFDDPKWSANTREFDGHDIRRFFRWAEGQGLTLKTITAADVAAYAAEIAASASPQAVSCYVCSIRRLFQHLVREGDCADNPCGLLLPDLRRSGRSTKEP